MRKFILWNSDKSSSFDFEVHNAIVINPSGLGLSLTLTKLGGKVVGYQREFETIKLDIIFGVGANAYTCYSDLALFIAANGNTNFILEYQVDSKVLYALVWVRKLTKSEKTGFGTIEESLSLERTTNWFTNQSGSVPTYPDGTSIENLVFDNLPIDLFFASTTGAGVVEVSIFKNMVLQSKIQLSIESGEIIHVLSEEKSIIINPESTRLNGYHRTSKNFDSFLVITKGIYTMSITSNTSIPTEVTYSYKKWVMD